MLRRKEALVNYTKTVSTFFGKKNFKNALIRNALLFRNFRIELTPKFTKKKFSCGIKLLQILLFQGEEKSLPISYENRYDIFVMSNKKLFKYLYACTKYISIHIYQLNTIT